MTKKMKEALAALGPEYTTKTIDFELCIYRDLGNGFDIEVSGMNNNRGVRGSYKKYKGRRRVYYCPDIWVWQTRDGLRTVEHVPDTPSLPALIHTLAALSEKYSKMAAPLSIE